MNTKSKILLVEDDQNLAEAYETRMGAEGFTVKRCDNGESALQMALDFKPDLILLDIMMPQIDGFDVLDILRNTPDTRNIKIVVLSALSQPSDIERAKQLGADDYLIKSQAVISDVMSRIRHHLGLEDKDKTPAR
jgi:two-component system, OmpR family, phosphate regulon response regulator PhoB